MHRFLLVVFILLFLSTFSTINAQPNQECCDSFKTGQFLTLHGVQVTRDTAIQKEIWIDSLGKKHKISYKVNWLNDRTYTLKLKQTNNLNTRKKFKKHQNQLVVRIIKNTPNSYTTLARWKDEMTWKFHNKLFEINNIKDENSSKN